jgi:hypothetical protein
MLYMYSSRDIVGTHPSIVGTPEIWASLVTGAVAQLRHLIGMVRVAPPALCYLLDKLCAYASLCRIGVDGTVMGEPVPIVYMASVPGVYLSL